MKELLRTYNSARVLIVDDMPVNTAILSSMLTTMGISCDLAESGQECLDMCRKNRYDLILLDHRMPGMDGVETLFRLKDIFRHVGVETPVVCHTADEGKKYINLYKAAGFADVLIKPVDPGKLMFLLMTYIPDGKYVVPSLVEKKKHIEHELASLPPWLKNIPQLDLKSGIEHCDTASAFLDTLRVFTQSIKGKITDIEKFENEENWPMYLLLIHSLKSTAKLIGANSIADKADDLEYAGSHNEHALVHALTPALIDEYKSMIPCYEKLISENNSVPKCTDHTVLFIVNEPGIVGKGITKALEYKSFDVMIIPDDPKIILNHRADSDILIYYPSGDNDHIKSVCTMLTEMCRDDNKILCLAGDYLDIETAQEIHDKECIKSVYPRPINLEIMAADITSYHDKLHGNERIRTILMIDDDPDFLHIMVNWLSASYNVDCSHSGASALAYLDRKRPDLILLDYEMPGMNGEKVLQRIRSNPVNERIPVVFLTGMNDKEGVLKLLENRPDGFLLKSIPREELLDSLQRFFSESSPSFLTSSSN